MDYSHVTCSAELAGVSEKDDKGQHYHARGLDKAAFRAVACHGTFWEGTKAKGLTLTPRGEGVEALAREEALVTRKGAFRERWFIKTKDSCHF